MANDIGKTLQTPTIPQPAMYYHTNVLSLTEEFNEPFSMFCLFQSVMAQPLKVPAQNRKRYRKDLADLPIYPSLAGTQDTAILAGYFKAYLHKNEIYVNHSGDVVRLYNMVS